MGKDSPFIMKPKNDFCFKELMADEPVRKSFLATVLELPQDEIQGTEMLPTILRKEFQDEKQGILDVRIRLNRKEQVNLEIQLAVFSHWEERSLFYLCKMFTEQIHPGQPYQVLQKCIHIGILDFVLFEEDAEYYSRFHLWEDQRKIVYSDKLELHVLELPKLKDGHFPESPLLYWAKFINSTTKEEFEMLAEKDPGLKLAYERLQRISADPEKRMEYEAREKALRDYQHQITSYWEQGYERGNKEGYERGDKAGYERGDKAGYERGDKAGYERGDKEGYERGDKAGYERGDKAGIQKAKRTLRLFAAGKQPEEIADEIGISVEEVKEILN